MTKTALVKKPILAPYLKKQNNKLILKRS